MTAVFLYPSFITPRSPLARVEGREVTDSLSVIIDGLVIAPSTADSSSGDLGNWDSTLGGARDCRVLMVSFKVYKDNFLLVRNEF